MQLLRAHQHGTCGPLVIWLKEGKREVRLLAYLSARRLRPSLRRALSAMLVASAALAVLARPMPLALGLGAACAALSAISIWRSGRPRNPWPWGASSCCLALAAVAAAFGASTPWPILAAGAFLLAAALACAAVSVRLFGVRRPAQAVVTDVSKFRNADGQLDEDRVRQDVVASLTLHEALSEGRLHPGDREDAFLAQAPAAK